MSKKTKTGKNYSGQPQLREVIEYRNKIDAFEKKFGILKPDQPSEEKRKWFNCIKEEISKSKIEKDWTIQSAQRHQWREEKRAGQTYQESDLELITSPHSCNKLRNVTTSS